MTMSMISMIRRSALAAVACAALAGLPAHAATRPVVSFVTANIADSARGVQQRALDVLLRDAVQRTRCLGYVDVPRRDSIARSRAIQKAPFTFVDLHRECNVRYGVFFALDRYGLVLQLATKVVTADGTALQRNDVALIAPQDTLEYRNDYEGALRRAMERVANAIARVADSTCPARLEQPLPIVVAGAVLHKMEHGFGVFLSDNATRFCNVAVSRITDSLRYDRRFMAVDLGSRDRIFSRLREFEIQNNSQPTAQEVAMLHAVGIPYYLVAEIDSAENYRKLRVSIHAFSTDLAKTDAVATSSRTVDTELELLYTTLNELAFEAAAGLKSEE